MLPEQIWCVTGYGDNGHVLQYIITSKFPSYLIAIQAGEPDIEEEDVRPAVLGGGHGVATIMNDVDLETDEFQQDR